MVRTIWLQYKQYTMEVVVVVGGGGGGSGGWWWRVVDEKKYITGRWYPRGKDVMQVTCDFVYFVVLL